MVPGQFLKLAEQACNDMNISFDEVVFRENPSGSVSAQNNGRYVFSYHPLVDISFCFRHKWKHSKYMCSTTMGSGIYLEYSKLYKPNAELVNRF